MAPSIPTIEPTRARAGDSWLWTAGSSFADYPASDGWALTYELRGVDAVTLGDVAGEVTVNGAAWDVVIAATRTAKFSAGSYEFVAVLTGSGTYAGRVAQVALPPLELLPSLIAAKPGARVPWAQTQLEAVDRAIASRVSGDEPEGYTIDGEQVQRIPIQQLYALRLRFAAEAAQAAAPQAFGRAVEMAFVPTSARGAGSVWD